MLISKPRIPIKQIIIFGFLPNFLKKWIYRLKGYKIGKGVSIGMGSVVSGERVTIGDQTSIGFFTIIRGKEISVGSHVRIGSMTFLDTPFLEIGEGSKINEQVFVGGLQFPDSRFVLGKNCQIMQMSFINPAKSIVVGDDTGIGGHCLIFGHTSWLSRFEGYPVEFLPIEIGNSVSLAWRTFVLPGTKIGDGAVIGADSLARGTIPGRCLAVGFPARVVAKYPDFPKAVSGNEKVEIFLDILETMTSYFEKSGLECAKMGSLYTVTSATGKFGFARKRTWCLTAVHEEFAAGQEMPLSENKIDLLLSLRGIPQELRKRLTAAKTPWIDIEKKEQSRFSNDLSEEVTQYLTRYGVRLYRLNE